MPSLFFWRATYRDGTSQTSDEIPYAAIDRRKLSRLEIMERATGKPVISHTIESSDCLIWRKRTQMKTGGKSETVQIVCRERGVGRFHIEVFNESDRTIRTYRQFSKSLPWLIEPERLPFEV